MQLSNIAIQYISLVKSGANGKEIIYKSAKEQGDYENVIAIKKTDAALGVVYGIVYSPDETDSQGDTATAVEIKKASYAFMKSLNATNVDVEHDFKNVDAFVAESWIIKAGDSVFPDEKEGAWAVAIQLESEELKAMAKSGEIAGLSMAGEAVKKSEEKDEGIANFFESLVAVMSGVYIDIHTRIEKGEKVDMDKYQEEMKEKMQKATADATKELTGVVASVKKAETATATQGKELEALKIDAKKKDEEIKALKEAVKAKDEELKKLSNEAGTTKEDVEQLKKEGAEVQEVLKKSGQDIKPKAKHTPKEGDL